MKSLYLTLLLTTGLTNCDTEEPAAHNASCVGIESATERLACYDAMFGRHAASAPLSAPPPTIEPPPPPTTTSQKSIKDEVPIIRPEIVDLVHLNEAKRQPGDDGFLISRSEESVPDHNRVVLSAPALGTETAPVYLAVSCLSNISRLQILTSKPIAPNQVNIRLSLDNRPVSDFIPWQVLEDGTVIDAGRGLVAIEQLRYFAKPATRLYVESDYKPFSGLTFDATALHTLIKQQREACHW